MKDEVVGDCIRDDGLESKTGDVDTPLVSRSRLDVEFLKVGVPDFGLLIDAASWLLLSSLLCAVEVLSFPPLTAPRKRLYNPLRPFCISSSAIPFDSTPDDEAGGEANSLKVVRLSDWDAVLCIASSAWASCSLSTCDDPVKDAREPRLERIPKGRVNVDVDPCGEWTDDMTFAASTYGSLSS